MNDDKNFAVYYIAAYPEPPFRSMEKRYVHPYPNVRQLCDEPQWMDETRAKELAREYRGTIIKKGDPE